MGIKVSVAHVRAEAPLPPFFAAMFAAALGLNFLWEMLQMPAYAEMSGRSWRETALACALASLGDAALTLGVYGAIALAARRLRWGVQGRRRDYIAVALLAAACALTIELVALATGRWSYLDRMPVVPALGVGLWPLLQLTLLAPLAMGAAVWWGGRSGPRYGAYDRRDDP